ncbi:MAG: NADH:ubiquinone reductase (Na(+)-transporting) subunit B [Salinivirgaceae bacterium]|nr:NADH:ubiquinone reductase (Na(+)-transporting) subunit B [Salinivirgaceae bacterium]MDD4747024.1 NADH:ubiquinone reductase (Na(+)-transporting) subunit B [Salinivirgaceae bacterium]MDY0279086.1 NADH:ubiquinone reductase (Na(+)-transporting) subunit B [Salinivirgaceae bacterium]
MKAVRKFFDTIKPHVQKGAKFHWLHSTYDAFETFAFVPNTTSKTGSHIHDVIDLKRTMTVVIVALLPALFFGIYNVGYHHYLSEGTAAANGFFDMFLFGAIKVLPIVIVSYVVGLGVEFLFAQLRGHQVNEGFLVSAMLIPLVMPPDVPLWMVAISTVFAVIFGKEVFGGTGMNILNPALTARAFLFFAYPSHISGDLVWIAEKADAYSGATPLALAASGTPQTHSIAEMFIGLIPGSIGETSVIAIGLGAILLLVTGIASWRIMSSAIIGGLTMGLLLNIFATTTNPFMEVPFWQHLIMGGFAFGVVFMATDPVSGSHTQTGKWIYGFLIGFLAILIRVLNPAYPEGVMLAILLMNVFAPLIDYYVVQSNVKRRLKYTKHTV